MADGYDMGGNLIPPKGQYVCPKYEENDFIVDGICGIKMPISDDTFYLSNVFSYIKKYAVMKVTDQLIILDSHSLVKFRSGYVCITGELVDCMQFLDGQSPECKSNYCSTTS